MFNEISPFRPYFLRKGLALWIGAPEFSHAITLNVNRNEISLRTLQRMFGRWCYLIDQMMSGQKRVSKKPTQSRFNAIAMPEHLLSNGHLHVAADFRREFWGKGLNPERLIKLHGFWEDITSGSGNMHIQLNASKGWGYYITKEYYRHGHDYILAADFHPL